MGLSPPWEKPEWDRVPGCSPSPQLIVENPILRNCPLPHGWALAIINGS